MLSRESRRENEPKDKKGCHFLLEALIPALIANGKSTAVGALSGAAGYGSEKALEATNRRRRR